MYSIRNYYIKKFEISHIHYFIDEYVCCCGYLSKQSDLEAQREDGDDDGDHCVQHEVEDVGHCPVGPA